jgi:hypothetical protein
MAIEVATGMAERGIRGFRNVLTGIVEFPMQIKKGFTNGVGFIDNEAGSKTAGTILGIFWAASPTDNDGVGVPLDGAYPWEEGEQYSIFLPNVGEGIKPIGRKLGRGIGNGLLGILEIPGQIKAGLNEGNVLKGAVKGIWYGLNPTAYGISNIGTAFVPNPENNERASFDQEWPWDALNE